MKTLQGTGVNPLEEGRRWVQWAEAAATENGVGWAEKQAKTSYNLRQFWDTKALHYQSDPIAWDELDLKAHKAWAALSNVGLVMDNPPAQDRYTRDAAEATAKARVIAQRLGKIQDVALLDKRAAENQAWATYAKVYGVDDTYKAAVMKSASDFMAMGPFGIPWWAWIAGAAGVYLILVRRW